MKWVLKIKCKRNYYNFLSSSCCCSNCSLKLACAQQTVSDLMKWFLIGCMAFIVNIQFQSSNQRIPYERYREFVLWQLGENGDFHESCVWPCLIMCVSVVWNGTDIDVKSERFLCIMYFPVGWPKHLDIPSVKSEAIQEVLASPNRSLFVVITSQSIHIWQCKPCVLIVTFRRSDDSVIVHGTNLCVEWRPDCSVLAVGVSWHWLLLFSIS